MKEYTINTFNDLPQDILVYLFDFLTFCDFLNTLLVCKKWYSQIINNKNYILCFKLSYVAKIVRCISIREHTAFSWGPVIKIADRLLFKISHDIDMEKMLYWKIYQVHKDIIPHIQYTKEMELITGKNGGKVVKYFLLSDRQASNSIFRIIKYLYNVSELKWVTVVVQPWGHLKRMADQPLINRLKEEEAAELFTEQYNDSEILNLTLRSTFEAVGRCTQFSKVSDRQSTLSGWNCQLAPMIEKYEESVFEALQKRLQSRCKKSKCHIS